MKNKKRLTINTLALGNLKQRKKQYTIMIIGIILAMVFSSSVLFLVTSIVNSTTELRNERYGKQNLIWCNVTEDEVNNCKKQNIIGESGYGHIIGSITSTDDESYDSAVLAWLDDTAYELENPVLIEGSFPTKENEIAIEGIMLSKMGISANVGDTITLNVKTQNGEETIDEYTQKDYKLVGILQNKVNYITFTSTIDEENIPSAFVCQNSKVDLGGKENLICYANFKNGEYSIADYKKLKKYLDSIGYENSNKTVAYISTSNVYYTNDNDAYNMQTSIVFIIIIIAVLMFVSCLGIINAFNSNLKERKRQIGLLRAVGTTKRQIINIFAREALLISLIATPISCLISFLVVKFIIGLMGEGYVFKPQLWAFVLSIGFSIVCVMLSALIPLFSATKITPMQAVRNIDATRKMKTKHIKSKKQFNVSKLISNRSITFGKGKQIVVSLILIVAIIGSGFAFSWYSYAKNNYYTIDSDYQLCLSADGWYASGVNFKNNNNGFSEADRQLVTSNSYIGSSYGIKKAQINLIVPFSTSDYRKLISGKYYRDYDNYDESEITSENYEKTYFYELREDKDTEKMQQLLQCNEYINTSFESVDTNYLESLSKYIYDGEINIDKINSGEEIILVAPKNRTLYYDDGKYGGLIISNGEDVDEDNCIFSASCDFHAGDEIEIAVAVADKPTDEEGQNDDHTIIPNDTKVICKKVKIGAIIEAPSTYNIIIDNFSVLTTTTAMNSMLPYLKYKALEFSLNTTCNDDVDKSVQDVLNSITSNVDQGQSASNYGFQQEQKAKFKKIIIAMLSIIILVFSISLSIINNTITASIRNSKQKIGTLRAVGADEMDLVKSYIYQLLSMLLWGTGIGLGGFGISYLILYLVQKSKGGSLEMIFNPLVSLIFVVFAFAFSSFNLWSKVRKEMKNSIVENIREL
jgi:putative ABC transport system permease protein